MGGLNHHVPPQQSQVHSNNNYNNNSLRMTEVKFFLFKLFSRGEKAFKASFSFFHNSSCRNVTWKLFPLLSSPSLLSCSLHRSSTTFLGMTIARKVADILSSEEESSLSRLLIAIVKDTSAFVAENWKRFLRSIVGAITQVGTVKPTQKISIAWSSTSGKTFSVVLSFRSVLKSHNNKNIFFSNPVTTEHLEHFISLWYECSIYIIRQRREGGGERIKKTRRLDMLFVVVAISDNLSSRMSFRSSDEQMSECYLISAFFKIRRTRPNRAASE